MPERSAAAFRDVISHLAGYVAHDLTTPLGSALEQIATAAARVRPKPVPDVRHLRRVVPARAPAAFRRPEDLPAAAQGLARGCTRRRDMDAVDAIVEQATGDARLRPDAVQQQIEREAVRGPDGGPSDQIERWLTGLEGQVNPTGRRTDAGSWSRGVWEQARDLIGNRPSGELETAIRRSRLNKLLEEAIKRVADGWGNEFAEATRVLEENAGHRIGGIEAALRKMSTWCNGAAAFADKKVEQLGVQVGPDPGPMCSPRSMPVRRGAAGSASSAADRAARCGISSINCEPMLDSASTRTSPMQRLVSIASFAAVSRTGSGISRMPEREWSS